MLLRRWATRDISSLSAKFNFMDPYMSPIPQCLGNHGKQSIAHYTPSTTPLTKKEKVLNFSDSKAETWLVVNDPPQSISSPFLEKRCKKGTEVMQNGRERINGTRNLSKHNIETPVAQTSNRRKPSNKTDENHPPGAQETDV
jgi:hypothetical protein